MISDSACWGTTGFNSTNSYDSAGFRVLCQTHTCQIDARCSQEAPVARVGRVECVVDAVGPILDHTLHCFHEPLTLLRFFKVQRENDLMNEAAAWPKHQETAAHSRHTYWQRVVCCHC